MTEWPLRHTCGEFWSLVYDYECAAVVVLCVPPPGSTNFPSFWPEGKHSKKYGPVFTIDHISHNHYTNIKTWVRNNIFLLSLKFFGLNLKKKLHKNIVLLILLIIFITIESVLLLLDYGCMCKIKLLYYNII